MNKRLKKDSLNKSEIQQEVAGFKKLYAIGTWRWGQLGFIGFNTDYKAGLANCLRLRVFTFGVN